MKKILLFALPLMVMCFASCEKDKWTDDSPIIQFKDPYFQQALLNKNTCWIYDEKYTGNVAPYDIDRNGDGQISEKEASVVLQIRLNSNELIKDISEITYFTALEYLDCSGTSIQSLDVSKNLTLKELGCGNNQNLTSLNASGCSALTHLYCSATKLSFLDLDECINLEYLECVENKQLSKIDLRYCVNLKKLWVHDNQLSSIDLNNNAHLIYLFCGGNQLTSLDLSNNIELTEFRCEDNPLQKIILYKYHMLDYNFIERIEDEYGDIIEYVE